WVCISMGVVPPVLATPKTTERPKPCDGWRWVPDSGIWCLHPAEKHMTTLTSHTDRPRPSDLLLFAALWVVLPASFRVAMLIDWVGTGMPTATVQNLLLGVFLGLLQDGFMAFQALIVMLVARRWLPGRTWLWLTGAVFVVYNVWAIFDVLLYYNIDLRMTSSFVHFLLDAEVFWDSVEDAGAWMLIGGMATVLVASFLFFCALAPRLERLRLEQQQALVGIGIGIGAVGSVVLGPGELMYMTN